jgi:hypothetical protein
VNSQITSTNREDITMTKFWAVLVLVAVAVCSQPAFAGQYAPVTEFTLSGYKTEQLARWVDTGPYGIFGYVQQDSQQVWETFVEFDLRSVTAGHDARLDLTIRSGTPEAVLIARMFDVSVYSGSGAPDMSLLGAGHLLTTVSVPAPPGPYQGVVKACSFDIASEVDQAIANGDQYLGFRLGNPVNVTPGSSYAPMVTYEGGSAIMTAVPEPSTLGFFTVGIAGLLGWRRWR